MAKIDFYDSAGAYYYGKLKDDGKIEIYDPQGNY